MGFFDKLKKGLTKTRETITEKIEKLVIGYADIDDDLLDELEEILIMADVGVNTTDNLMEAVRKGIKKKEINSPEDLKPFLERSTTEGWNFVRFVYSDRVEHSARRFRADLSPFQSNLSALLSTPFRKSSAYLSGDECNDRFNIPPESLFRAL